MWMDRVQNPGLTAPADEVDDENTIFDKRKSYTNGIRSTNPFEMEEIDLAEEDVEETCGCRSWSPEWLQKFVTGRVFVVFFTFAAFLQGMNWAYFTSIISTLEKRYGISSTWMGVIISCHLGGQFLVSIFMPSSKLLRNRSRLIVTGLCLSTLGFYLIASCHVFYGAGKAPLTLGRHYSSKAPLVGDLDSEVTDLTSWLTTSKNGTSTVNVDSNLDSKKAQTMYSLQQDEFGGITELCEEEDLELKDPDDKSFSDSHSGSWGTLLILMISQFLCGVGFWLFSSLGGPYVEDLVLPNKLPIIFGLSSSIRMLGTLIGYVFASTCLVVYISLGYTSAVPGTDTRWLGAWWLGYLTVAFFLTLFSFGAFLFPPKVMRFAMKKRSVSTNAGISMIEIVSSAMFAGKAELSIANPIPALSKLQQTLNKILENTLYRDLSFSSAILIFCSVGYWSFMPKYLEIMFRKTAAQAAALTGTIGMVSQSIGLIIGGFLVSKFLPSPRKLHLSNLIAVVSFMGGSLLFSQFGCDAVSNIHLTVQNEPSRNSYSLAQNCSADCQCHLDNLLPACDEATQTQYFSPCHAGCKALWLDETKYFNCLCAPNATLSYGICSENTCSAETSFFIFLTIIIQIVIGAATIGRMMISYRSLGSTEGRYNVIGLTLAIVTLLSFIPSPIVYGKLMDSTCIVWNFSDEDTAVGHCVLYNTTLLRYLYNLCTAAMLIGTLFFDIRIWRSEMILRIELYEDTLTDIGDPVPITAPGSSETRYTAIINNNSANNQKTYSNHTS